jgi:hypothetical protein
VHAAMGEIGYLSLSAMAEPRDAASTYDQPLSLQKVLQAANNLCGSEPYLGKLKPALSLRRTPALRSDLSTINEDETKHFESCFLEEAPLRTPAFSADLILSTHAALFPQGVTVHVIGSSKDLATLLAYSIVSIGILHSPDSTSLKPLASKLHEVSVELMPSTIEKEDNVLTLRLLLALTIYSIYTGDGGSAWHFIGTTIRRLIALGYHRKRQLNARTDHEEVDVQCWLFWTAYFLDRYILAFLKMYGVDIGS